MRYEDWDILLFPRNCKVPVKEFKVSCHVIHDSEFAHTHGSFGLPTMSCFVPSLAPGSQFLISMHSWSVPPISQVTKAYTKFPDEVKLEARLFMDGRLVASATLDRQSTWPHVIAHSFDFSKSGDLEPLKFPTFREELLQQSYWSPADDLGRIKVVISEGFPRDSLSMPIERVKNTVAFSFQHAPLDILESSSIAWPNSSMWRRAPFITSMSVPTYPSDDAESHAHSPRRRTSGVGNAFAGLPVRGLQQAASNAVTANIAKNASQPVQANMALGTDAFEDSTECFDWLNHLGTGLNDVDMIGQTDTTTLRKARKTDTDISMPDYVSSTQNGQIPFSTDSQFTMSSFEPESDSYVGHMKVPTNTPTTSATKPCESGGAPYPVISDHGSIPADLAHALTNSLLNQPMPIHLQGRSGTNEVKSRKENRNQQAVPSPSAFSSASTPAQEHKELRRVSQQLYIPSGGSIPLGVAQQQSASPKSFVGSDSLQKMPTLENFGISPHSLIASSQDGVTDPPSSFDKETNGTPNFLSESVRTNEDDYESLRESPQVRLTPFAEEDPTVVTD